MGVPRTLSSVEVATRLQERLLPERGSTPLRRPPSGSVRTLRHGAADGIAGGKPGGGEEDERRVEKCSRVPSELSEDEEVDEETEGGEATEELTEEEEATEELAEEDEEVEEEDDDPLVAPFLSPVLTVE